MFKVRTRDTIKTYAYGHDFGNSETCGFVLAGRAAPQKIMIPSVWTPGTWSEVEETAGSMGGDARSYMKDNHFHLHYVGKKNEVIDEYFGQKVFDDRLPVSEALGDMERYWRNNLSLKSLMVASGKLIQDQTYELYVTTGVPVKYYSDTMKTRIEEALKGTYTFTLNSVGRTMVVRSVRVISEAAGALIAYGKNDGRDEGIIDVGGYTTDLFGARSQQPIASMRHAKPSGVNDAIKMFNRKFKEAYGVELNMNSCRLVFREHAAKKPFTKVRDLNKKEVPLRDVHLLADEALKSVGASIASFIESSWSNNPDIEHALLVGGGAYYFKDYIAERFPYVKIPAEPEFANAQGYATLSAHALAKVAPQEGQPTTEEVAG